MKSVLLKASTLTQSGYGTHARQIAKWLLTKKDIDIKFMLLPWGGTPWIIDNTAHDGLVKEIMQRSVPPETKADVGIHLQLPNEWDTRNAPINIGVSAVVETDRCSPAWVEACNRMHAVVVPSQHSKACLLNTAAVTCPLLVVPESYVAAIDSSHLPDIGSFSTSFNFLVFGQLTHNDPANDRKNTFNTIKWLCEAFVDDPDVGIVLKTNSGTESLIDRQVTTNLIAPVANLARKGKKTPRVHLLHGDMSDAEVAALYRHPSIKALVTLTRGEGWGLPILEAAASGLPVIATGWSGHMDFMKQGKFISLAYQLEEIHKSRVDNNIFVPGARWANVNEGDFKKKVVKFRSSPATPREWAQELQKKVKETYSFEAICRAWDAALKEYL